MTTLASRPAQLGPTINDRTEMHGNEGKPEAIAAGAVWSTLRERWEWQDGSEWKPGTMAPNSQAAA